MIVLPPLNYAKMALLLGILVLTAATLAFTYLKGVSSGKEAIQAIRDVERGNHAALMAEERFKHATTEKEVLVKYLPKVEYIREKAKEIIKEVPVYVTVEDDTKCTIPDGFIWLHDIAASAGDISEAKGSAGATGTASTPAKAKGVDQ